MATERLHVALAHAGVASRRAAEDLIRQGRVTVNGQIVTGMGVQIDPERDRVAVDGMPVDLSRSEQEPVYLAMYKPVGYVTTTSDQFGRPAVLDLVPPQIAQATRVYPVGRLDYESEGLLLLTDDGEFAQLMMHPRYSPPKEYHVLVRSMPASQQMQRLRSGILLDGRMTAPVEVDLLPEEAAPGRRSGGTWLRFILHEGRNRQIRRMCEAVGLSVVRLIRTRIGPVRLQGLNPGQTRSLRPDEVRKLIAATKNGSR